MRFPFVLILGSFLFSVGCEPSPRGYLASHMDDVESYINERPDSALAVLERLDPSCFRSDRKQARYYLLKAIAQDKAYVDSGLLVNEMEKAATYYASHGNSTSQMQAYYYLADQQKDAGRHMEAAVNFSRALELAEEHENHFISGMSAGNLSTIFCSVYNYTQALDYARRSVDAFMRAGKPNHVMYARLQVADGLYNCGRFDECIASCDSLIAVARLGGNSGLLADILSTSASAYVKKEMPDSTICRLEEVERYYPLSAKQRAVYAWALCLDKQYDRAGIMLKDAYRLAASRQDSLIIAPWDARISERTNDYQRSTRLFKLMLDGTDEQILMSIPQAVERAQSQYYKLQQTVLRQEIRQNKGITMAIMLIAVLIITSLLLLLRLRRIRAEQYRREQHIRLEEKEQACLELSRKLSLYGSTVEETLDFGFGVLNQLSEAYFHPNTAQENSFRDIISNYVSDISSRKHLGEAIERNINIIHDDVISKLRKEVPVLKDKDIKLFSLYLFGFSYKAISAFSPGSSSLNTSYSQVFRLKKKIENSGSPNTSFFLSFLENRPTNGKTNK